MPALYQLADEMAAALRLADDADGEIGPELEAALDALGLSFEAKVENVCRAHRQYLADAAVVSTELDRLGQMHRRLSAQAEWLKTYLLRCLIAAGRTRVESDLFRVRVQENSQVTVTLLPDCPIPEGFAVTKTETRLDARKVAEAVRRGEPVPDGVRVVKGCHVRIQ